MNDTTIEKLLRKPPPLKVPGTLLKKLQEDIVLPRPQLTTAERNDWRPSLKRWIPALSFGAFFLGCLIAIAVQSNVLSELRRENNALRDSTANLEPLRHDNAEYQRLALGAQQLEQLRKDNAALETLRNEVAQLRQQAQELATLRAENQRLRQQNSAEAAAGGEEEDPFGEAKAKAQRVQCVSNLKQVCLAARMWANDHNEILPRDFLTMQNELNSPKILVCPGDTARPRTSNWAEFSGSSYTILSPGVSERRPEIVYVRCPIHNNVGLVDGSVSQIGPNFAVVQNEQGNWVIKRQQ